VSDTHTDMPSLEGKRMMPQPRHEVAQRVAVAPLRKDDE
jgi:hypothetical protein